MGFFMLDGQEVKTKMKTLKGLSIKRLGVNTKEDWSLFMEMPDGEPDAQISDKRLVFVNGKSFYCVPPAIFGEGKP